MEPTRDNVHETEDANPDDEADAPSLRQRLASAAGDRHAEAKALADRAGDAVGPEEAEVAVRAAHGDIEVGAEDPDREHRSSSELASPSDAKHLRDRTSE